MASCDLAQLQADACANGYFALSKGDAWAAILQSLYNVSGETPTLNQLLVAACSNHFLDADVGMQKAVTLQLLCNVIGGASSDCNNLVPDDSFYSDDKGNFDITSLLTLGQGYSVQWGENEVSITVNATTINSTGVGTISHFTYSDDSSDSYLSGTDVSISVTAQLCAI